MKQWMVVAALLCLVAVVPKSAMAGGWLIYHDGPYEGVVLDDETGEPIEGAAVVAVWRLDQQVSSKFFDAKEAVTDKAGKFKLTSKIGFDWFPLSSLGAPEFTIFKPGYDTYPPRLPITGRKTSMEEEEQAHKQRRKYIVNFKKIGENIVRLRRANNKEERLYVLPGGIGGLSSKFENDNLHNFNLQLKLERDYLDMM